MSRGFTQADFSYEQPGEGFEHDPHKVADLALTKTMAEVLERHYPGYPWMIEVDSSQGIAKISIPLFMGAQNKYVLHLSHLKSDPGFRCVVRAAGEILERYKIPRRGFSVDAYEAAMNNIPKALLGTKGFVPG